MYQELLLSVGALCAINAILALAMVIADATIGNYGTAVLTLNDTHKFDVQGGQSLLTSLKEEGVFIPSSCGGRATCGLCKVRLAEKSEPLATELPFISAQERAEGVRLSCQVKVKGDMELFVPEALLSVKEYRATVVALNDLTHDIKELRFKLLDPPTMDFAAGQFVQLEVPPYALTSEPVYRAYSISSDPVDTNQVELEVRLVPNGICTTWVHQHLKVGDTLTFNGPHGDFKMHEGTGEIICIAGGSGMAPIKSLLLELVRNGNQRPVRYFFGARSKRDLFLVDEMRELEKRMPSFRFIPALSDALPEDNWDGTVGRIDHVVDKEMAANAEETQAYLCGSPLMIDSCVKILHSKGVKPDNIFYDKFT